MRAYCLSFLDTPRPEIRSKQTNYVETSSRWPHRRKWLEILPNSWCPTNLPSPMSRLEPINSTFPTRWLSSSKVISDSLLVGSQNRFERRSSVTNRESKVVLEFLWLRTTLRRLGRSCKNDLERASRQVLVLFFLFFFFLLAGISEWRSFNHVSPQCTFTIL